MYTFEYWNFWCSVWGIHGPLMQLVYYIKKLA
jgi:hypothetical protein